MRVVRLAAVFAGFLTAAWIARYIVTLGVRLTATGLGDAQTVPPFATAVVAAAALIVFGVAVTLLIKIIYKGRPVDRILIVLVGYAAACVGAGLVLTFGLWLVGVVSSTDKALPAFLLFPGTIFASGIIAGFALLPSLLIIAVAELCKVRSVLFYGTAGIAAAILSYSAYIRILTGQMSLGDVLAGLIFTAIPGLTAGLIYWRIAGRGAGATAVPSSGI